MGQKRFKALGLGSFFGDLVYTRVVPRDHFLVRLNQLIDWEQFVPILLPAYEGLAEEGRPPYSPIVLLKMLLITYLYKLSERQTEEFVNFELAAKEFVGLAIDEPAPDHSTLSVFKYASSIMVAGTNSSRSATPCCVRPEKRASS